MVEKDTKQLLLRPGVTQYFQGGEMKKIGIIGMGNMGEAILKAFIKNGAQKASILCAEAKSARADFIMNTYGIKCYKDPGEIVKKAQYLVLAVKPQDSKNVLQAITPYFNDKKVLISIMAGITTSNILSIVGKEVKVVRIMPNICVKVGEGAMGLTSNNIALPEEVEEVKTMFSSMGKTVEVSEELMDAITALGGSGPAFVLLFLEAMIDAGVKLGLPRDKSSTISSQVIKGTIKMLETENLHPTIMREMITSPGGTTIAGLTTMEQGALKGTVIRAIEDACKRSKELSL
jgi:pyrroline-5-carboxylate reductase